MRVVLCRLFSSLKTVAGLPKPCCSVFLFPLRVLRKQEEDEWGEGKEKGKSKGIIFFFPECIYSRKQALGKMSRR